MQVAIMYLCKREELAYRVRGWNAGTFCALVIPQGKLQKQGQSHL